MQFAIIIDGIDTLVSANCKNLVATLTLLPFPILKTHLS